MPKEYELNFPQTAAVVSSLSSVIAVTDNLVAADDPDDETECEIRYNADREACLARLKELFAPDGDGAIRVTDAQARRAVAAVLKDCLAKLEKRG